MTLFLKISMHVSIAFLVIACGDDKKVAPGKNQETASIKQTPVLKKQPSQGVAIKDDNLNAIYQHYLDLSEALIDGKVAKAKISSNAIEAGAREMTGGALIASSAAKITAAANLHVQRAAYSNPSNEMIARIKKAGLNQGEIYVEYCPMAMNDKGGYWLSSSKEIRNPYFGDVMLSCGEVKETMK